MNNIQLGVKTEKLDAHCFNEMETKIQIEKIIILPVVKGDCRNDSCNCQEYLS